MPRLLAYWLAAAGVRHPADGRMPAPEGAGLPPHPGPWFDMDRGARHPRLNARVRHPAAWLRSQLARHRGVTAPHGTPVSSNDVLERLSELPISLWSYGFDHRSVRHLGPMAQDFAAAFGLGATDRRISSVDANGVALAAIQALHRRLAETETALEELRRHCRYGP
jgi:hypothetical protein